MYTYMYICMYVEHLLTIKVPIMCRTILPLLGSCKNPKAMWIIGYVKSKMKNVTTETLNVRLMDKTRIT